MNRRCSLALVEGLWGLLPPTDAESTPVYAETARRLCDGPFCVPGGDYACSCNHPWRVSTIFCAWSALEMLNLDCARYSPFIFL